MSSVGLTVKSVFLNDILLWLREEAKRRESQLQQAKEWMPKDNTGAANNKECSSMLKRLIYRPRRSWTAIEEKRKTGQILGNLLRPLTWCVADGLGHEEANTTGRVIVGCGLLDTRKKHKRKEEEEEGEKLPAIAKKDQIACFGLQKISTSLPLFLPLSPCLFLYRVSQQHGACEENLNRHFSLPLQNNSFFENCTTTFHFFFFLFSSTFLNDSIFITQQKHSARHPRISLKVGLLSRCCGLGGGTPLLRDSFIMLSSSSLVGCFLMSF